MRTQIVDGVKETIIHEDQKYRFLITTHDESTEGKFVFFVRVLSNPLASSWKYFETENDAFSFGKNHVSKYLEETEQPITKSILRSALDDDLLWIIF